ncbi:hypothetical protein AGABI2DRAFT_120609 [Agaricus bisporus var. bisporus H97]|uniref:hypothetical protein n=1 Tax=Agaricus bisporus var. bisporus (strain H97 / ATCC MYA-4626 / FGSC 10389) TaxID=936046 RepID=UPI00029F76B2|nr:hypothetical protein AGABI2DRAFT_120609 [Agaricus bisporus var. bisporus H97]EKV44484.1 hypothetical protein AGABI2DRAFT_120609 [Agaricus bisporus var. bisporus H97]
MNTSPKPGPDDCVSDQKIPSRSSYLPLVLCGSYWRTQDSFKNIVVFGDSYSTSFQGTTWVNHLVRQLQKRGCSPNVHNFAVPGHTAEEDLSDQLSLFFKKFPEQKSSDAISALDSAATTYFVFLGINDCGRRRSEALEFIVEDIFDTVHDLYVKAQARNFVLIDVPLVDRSPQGNSHPFQSDQEVLLTDASSAIELECMEKIEERVETWNKLLRTQAIEFQSKTTDATVLIFSSHKLFSDILDDPLEYEFTEDDPETEGGGIWVDDLHPTSEVHDILGEQIFTSVLA